MMVNKVQALTVMAILFAAGPVAAECADDDEVLVSCRIDGQDAELSVCLSAEEATYRLGPVDDSAELKLVTPLTDLDYRRKEGPGTTIDEIVTFRNNGEEHRIAMGFRNDEESASTGSNEFADLTILRDGNEAETLSCVSETITRAHDLLIPYFTGAGRDTASDGASLPEESINSDSSASEAPVCEKEHNVDTCWSRGVDMERDGDLPGALAQFEMSCDAGIQLAGCYEAGKLYLHNPDLRDYPRAYDRFSRMCQSDDIGGGPYACKFMGWMHHTGIGVERNRDDARYYLSRACFMHNDLTSDAEGCHFLAEHAQQASTGSQAERNMANYVAYLSLAMGCTDGAEGVCTDAGRLLATPGDWQNDCEQAVAESFPEGSCESLLTLDGSYEEYKDLRQQLRHLFLEVADVLP